MKRAWIALTAGAAALAVAVPSPAQANPPVPATSYAAAVKISPGAGVSTQVTTGGAIGGLLDFLTPVLNQVVTPLTSQLSALPGTLVSDLATLTGGGYSASSNGSTTSPPSSGYPTCSAGGWTSDNCFGPTVPNVAAAPLLSVGTGTLQGYATADSTGAYGQARTAGVMLTVLGLPIGNLGAVESSAQCLSTGVCKGQATLADLSLLGGAITARTGDDGSLQVALNHSAFATVGSYGSPTTLAGTGLTASAQAAGGRLKVTISLSLDQLLSALGVPNTLVDLNASDAGSTIALTVTIGSSSSSDSESAKAAGLQIGLGVNAAIGISILGLATIQVAAQDTSDTGDLVDLQLGYTTAASGDNVGPSGAPPDLT